MGAHLIDGEFQSDKYPSTPRGKVPLSVKDPTAQDLLWVYAQRRRKVDSEFSDDLETALEANGFVPPILQEDKLFKLKKILTAAEDALSAAATVMRSVVAISRDQAGWCPENEEAYLKVQIAIREIHNATR